MYYAGSLEGSTRKEGSSWSIDCSVDGFFFFQISKKRRLSYVVATRHIFGGKTGRRDVAPSEDKNNKRKPENN